MGIKGTVKRSTDGDFIHANVDIDLIITEEPEIGNIEKPVEIFHIIEHFCLGRRRLHLFGRDSTIRPGRTSGKEKRTLPSGMQVSGTTWQGWGQWGLMSWMPCLAVLQVCQAHPDLPAAAGLTQQLPPLPSSATLALSYHWIVDSINWPHVGVSLSCAVSGSRAVCAHSLLPSTQGLQ